MRNEKDSKSYYSSSNRRNSSQRQQSQSSHPYTGPPPTAPTQVGTSTRASESVWARGPPTTKSETPIKTETKQEPKEPTLSSIVVPRPTYTSTLRSGRPISLVCNHFPFVVVREPLYQFALEFKPEIDSFHLKMKVLHTMIQDNSLISSRPYISDGSTVFFKEHVGNIDQTVVFGSHTYFVSLTFSSEIPTGVNAPLQLYNLLFRKILRDIGLKQIGRNYYDPTRPINIPKYNVELWPGFVTAVNANARGIMLIAEIAHKVLRTDSVLDLYNQLQIDFPKKFKEKFSEQVLKQTVLTRYNNRTYRIDEIAWDMNANSTFRKRNGQELSFAQYYMDNYNKTLSTSNQPLLVHKHRSKNEEIIYLIPELCTMTGVSETMRADAKVMKDVAGHTRVSPEQRGIELNKFVQTLKNSASVSKEMVYWGVDLSTNMLPVTGRVFDPERICYANNKQNIVDPRTGEWSSLCRNSQVLASTPLVNWLLIYYENNAKIAAEFSTTLIKVAHAIGFTIKKPQIVEIQESKLSFAEAIQSNVTDKSQFVVCLFPKMNKDRYDAVKHTCTTKLGIPSQCLILRSLMNEKTIISVCNKIAMQINCKMGGELWKLEIPLKRTMIVGIDVCHDISRGGESVAGFCATMNDNYTKYCSSVQFQRGGQEIIDGLKLCMGEALRQFFKCNGHLPSLIIVYRDGVGDGMLDAVVKHEVTQMKSAFSMFGENFKPRFAVIVVKKRINTRLFTSLENGGLGNPPPGTIVDTDCVHPTWYDFYVVSQSVKQGTASPTHYHVVYDTTELQQEHVQKLTYKLTHLYYNWAGTIRVPAPCQYAHKIAFLVGQHLHVDPHQQLGHVLHYL